MDGNLEKKIRGLWGRLKAFVGDWGIDSGGEVASAERESWLEHKLDSLWEVEENQVLLHYEKLSQEG
jgi:hypothetical protein